MLCDKCGKNPATVHYKQVINGVAQEQHLCENCAGGGLGFGTLDLNKLFSAAVPQRREAISCPVCGLSLAEFNQSGRLGCSRCYEAFGEAISPLIRRYHGERRHRGKLKRPTLYQAESGEPLSPPEGELANKTYEKLALQKQLAELVELEKFEEAAKVRDRLKEISAELTSAAEKANGRAGDGI